MRFFVLMLLVLLLPLRGGLGDAMAAAGPHHGVTMSHGSPAPAKHALQDCPGHTGQAKAHAHAQVQVDHAAETKVTTVAATVMADCDACSACQACHAVGLVVSASEVQALPAPHSAPAANSLQFASAPAARDQKPPIS